MTLNSEGTEKKTYMMNTKYIVRILWVKTKGIKILRDCNGEWQEAINWISCGGGTQTSPSLWRTEPRKQNCLNLHIGI